jgi:signal transduction histidine kinase
MESVPKRAILRMRRCGRDHALEPAAREHCDSPSLSPYPPLGRFGPHSHRQYLGDISHELRAPISRIKILLECARQSPQQICSYLARIEENVLRMQALTKSLLDFSRLELVDEPLARERCDLAQLISQVVEDARIEARARGCIIQPALIPDCILYANYESLHQAIENVVRNSVKYTKEGSSISVVLARPANGVAQIVVEDEGPGISEEELKEVFKPFYRTSDARADGTPGTGLGLAISERAIKLHQGTIEVSNRCDGKGLQVAIKLPIHRP